MVKPETIYCPLCYHGNTHAYHRDKVRSYLNCLNCDLVFVPSAQHLHAADEKAYYDLHDNQLYDPAYRLFLDRLFSPLNQRLKSGASGLDVGCGPGPALAKMLEEAGHTVALYDPYYAPDKSVLSQTYDFITLSEVVEHMAKPGRDLEALWPCLVPGGWLAIMTKRVRDPEAFKTWHYITDPTHISYFSKATFIWLRNHLSTPATPTTLTIIGNDVALIHKG